MFKSLLTQKTHFPTRLSRRKRFTSYDRPALWSAAGSSRSSRRSLSTAVGGWPLFCKTGLFYAITFAGDAAASLSYPRVSDLFPFAAALRPPGAPLRLGA
ncbi:hypothetical protein EVAR_68325_1 [Eumeta japonica]|uniref:Uncharacterized protein n=1 Tax=Eumeta variegata TaxID=151549 RepID=A0A4C2AGL9_EUMVA|nr:hypothetical protein EVAR_68325_1 [Eumeta japonica]